MSGALGGVAADLAAGGLTFGAGALLGGIAGALGARTLAQRYNAQRGAQGSELRWSESFLQQRLGAAVLRYLAVAHFGRGRGEFVAGEVPAHWTEMINAVLDSRAATLGQLLRELHAANEPPPAFTQQVTAILWDVLSGLYPDAARTFDWEMRSVTGDGA